MGAGEGARPLPAQAGPGARCTRAGGLPLAKLGRFSWEMLTEMLHQWTISPYLAGLDADRHLTRSREDREGFRLGEVYGLRVFA